MRTYVIVVKLGAEGASSELKVQGARAVLTGEMLQITDESGNAIAGAPVPEIVCWYCEGLATLE